MSSSPQYPQPPDVPHGVDPPMAIPMHYAAAAGPLKTGMAVASLVLGIIGFATCGVVGIVALILGIIALTRANSRPLEYGGKGLAIAGVTLGGVSLIALPLLLISILLPSLSRARELAKRAVDAANLRGVGQAWHTYYNDHNAEPADFATLTTAGLITPGQLQDPADANATNACDYHFVANLGESNAKLLGEEMNAGKWLIAWCDPAYHGNEGGNILFLDGHAEFRRQPAFDQTIDQFKKDYEAKSGKPPKIIPPK